jgi:hypothetical protein
MLLLAVSARLLAMLQKPLDEIFELASVTIINLQTLISSLISARTNGLDMMAHVAYTEANKVNIYQSQINIPNKRRREE